MTAGAPGPGLQVGLVGAGLMGRTHARAWASLPDLGQSGGLVAMYTPDDAARALARQHGLYACDTMAELHGRVDVVDLCTPTPSHPELALAAAAAGCHVICEKPIALTLEDAQAMILGCERAGVRLFIAQVLRFFPQYREAQRRVAAGEIGTPRVLRLSRVGSPPPVGSWFRDVARSGGVEIDLMLHDLDYARWLAGEVDEVYAVQAGPAASPLVTVQATLRHRSGALSLIEAGWAAPPGVFRTSLDLAGTKGTIEWSSDARPALVEYGAPVGESTDESLSAALPMLEGDPFAAELAHAYRALRGGQPFLVTPHDAAGALALGLAVQASVRSGRAVPVPAWGQP